MAKVRKQFVCQSCGALYTRWNGKCVACDAFNTIEEVEATTLSVAFGSRTGLIRSIPIDEVQSLAESALSSGEAEFDRVLGGGFRPSGVYLLGGAPGIGKSTLALSACAAYPGLCLYVSGEESAGQIKERLDRLGAGKGTIRLMATSNLDDITQEITNLNPGLVILDSVQTVASPEIPAGPGSVGQVREAGSRLSAQARMMGHSLLMIGHLTKDGQLAGPRMLEHLVDTVLYFESEDRGVLRMLRSFKNRFGSTHEVGLFEMTGEGLIGLSGSASFLLRDRKPAQGSVVTVSMEGQRPLVLEIQALTSPAGFSQPRRTVTGLDPNRVAMVAAVLERHLGVRLADQDLFVNVTGGVRITDPSADLPVALAIWSSFNSRVLPMDLAAFGEIGLTGEIRPVQQADQRLAEAAQLGFHLVLCPSTGKETKESGAMPIRALSELLDHLP